MAEDRKGSSVYESLPRSSAKLDDRLYDNISRHISPGKYTGLRIELPPKAKTEDSEMTRDKYFKNTYDKSRDITNNTAIYKEYFDFLRKSFEECIDILNREIETCTKMGYLEKKQQCEEDIKQIEYAIEDNFKGGFYKIVWKDDDGPIASLMKYVKGTEVDDFYQYRRYTFPDIIDHIKLRKQLLCNTCGLSVISN